ncbi:zinc finger, CCHC-type containing protein, partial [Tanacetum coccineum]
MRMLLFGKEAINDEMDSIMGNNTWVLVDLPPRCKPLGCKWIFKKKLKVDGTIEKFKARLVIQGFKQNLIIHQMDVKTTFLNGELDKSKFDETGKGVIICLYVDDMLIFGTDQVQVDLTKEFLSSRFSMKDMGEADKFSCFDFTPMSTPMDTSEKLMPNNGQAVFQLDHSRVIGYLMYAMTCTRPDIAFVVGKPSRYTSNPDNSSASGWVLLLGGGAISWASKKQTCITGSTMESEFMALVAAGKEVEWLKNLLLEIPLWSKPIA